MGVDSTFQISSAYCWMVRSELNLPEPAVYMIDLHITVLYVNTQIAHMKNYRDSFLKLTIKEKSIRKLSNA